MKAVVCTALGGPEVLKVQDWPNPAIKPDEVRVRIHAAGVNFADLLVISAKYHEEWTPPFVLGTEGAGIVAECGEGVTAVVPGDRVLVQNNSGRGCYADEVVVPAFKVAKLPAELDFVQAACLPINYGTSYYALTERGQLKSGETIVIHGASGGVGLAAVQIAKAIGATVIATGGNDEKLARVAEFGADFTVNCSAESFPGKVLEITDGKGADCYFDPVGGDIFDQSLKAIAFGGRILVIGFTSGRIPAATNNRVLFKGISVVGAPYGGFTKRFPDRWAVKMQEILDMTVSGKLRPHVAETFPFGGASKALQLVKEREVVGKYVLLSDAGMPA